MIAWLPRYAPWAARLSGSLNLREPHSGLARLWRDASLGLSAERFACRKWRGDAFLSGALRLRAFRANNAGRRAMVVLLVDTFNHYFEPDNARAALAVLRRLAIACTWRARPAANARHCAAGALSLPADWWTRPGGRRERTHRRARGLMSSARLPIIGLEPVVPLYPARRIQVHVARPRGAKRSQRARCCSRNSSRAEYCAGRLESASWRRCRRRSLLHGHCHQKAFGAMGAVRVRAQAWSRN